MRVPGIPFIQGRNDYADSDDRKYGIAIHNTSNDASDTDEAGYATHRTDGVSSHFYCDADSVTQSLDTDDKAGHAGSTQGNENAIAVEITGTNNKSRDWWLQNVAWDKLGEVLAYVIKHDSDFAGFQVRRASVAEMKTNPKVKAFYGHNDMRLAWGGTTHTDPGDNFPWDRLFTVVNKHLEGNVALTDSEINAIADRVWDKALWDPTAQTHFTAGATLGHVRRNVRDELAPVRTQLVELSGKDWTDEEAIINGVLTGLAARPAAEAAELLRAVLTPEQLAALKEAL